MVRVLLDYGLNVNILDNLGSTPLTLHWSILQGGNTPLHRASRSGRIEIARLLVEHGANVEVQDDGADSVGRCNKRAARRDCKILSEHRAR
ncbi:hypothetical protein BJV77DRAFT_1033268 [Russula vinacea]|nr:hypothetical protein BJV77DRAFT_1033268 [Russula vinacea]